MTQAQNSIPALASVAASGIDGAAAGAHRAPAEDNSMLLVLPVPFRAREGRLLFESQACNGLEQWSLHFDPIVLAVPTIPEYLAVRDRATVWKDTAELKCRGKIELVPLPWAYKLSDFVSHLRETRRLLAGLVARCRYLQFGIGGMIGDWAAIAAIEARRQGRPYSIHTDRVEHEVVLREARGASLERRIKARVVAPLMQRYEAWIIKHCGFGLFHGSDCYRAYKDLCQYSHIVHDVHTKPQDVIVADALEAKAREAEAGGPLRVVYTGRMAAMKAPQDWVRAMARAREQGADVRGAWLGDGPLFGEVRALASALKLDGVLEMPGFVGDRTRVLEAIRGAHAMVFTHVTPESPRCLIESFVCGTPIIGYGSSYPEDLIHGTASGELTPMGDPQKLGDALAALWRDRARLGAMIRAAGENGRRFSDEAVFRERSDLIKQYLGASSAASIDAEPVRVISSRWVPANGRGGRQMRRRLAEPVRNSLLLVLPVPFRQSGGRLYFESQACNGLARWADHFRTITLAVPVLPEWMARANKSISWMDTGLLPFRDRVEFVPLPWAYRLSDFVYQYRATRQRLAEMISRSEFLQFGIGGLVGDWAAVAALEARRMGRPYAVHTDRVEHEVILRESTRGPVERRFKARFMAPLVKASEAYILRHSELALLHGSDCFQAYKHLSPHGYLIHNTHTKPSDCIAEPDLQTKADAMETPGPLYVVYTGRLAPMKAPLDWVRAIARARELGADVRGRWLGEGPMLGETRALISRLGLEGVIELVGFVGDRKAVLDAIRGAQAMLFTHVTPESPRCLIEALVCGTPIVGYHSAYPEDLVDGFGGGAFVAMHDHKALGELLAELNRDRPRLSALVREAGHNGQRFNDAAVFKERSELIKRHLTLGGKELATHV